MKRAPSDSHAGGVPVAEPTLADRLKAVRGARTQDEIADALQLHKNTVWRWENEGRDVGGDVLAGVCLIFEIDPRWLLLGIGPKDVDLANDQARELWKVRREIWLLERPDPDKRDAAKITALRQRADELAIELAQQSTSEAPPDIELDLMRQVIDEGEAYLREQRLDLEPAKKAQLFVTLYELVRARSEANPSAPIDLSLFKNVIRLAR